MARNAKIGTAPRAMHGYLSMLESLPYVSQVSICGFDKKRRHLEDGCYLDSKAEEGYRRHDNAIPLSIIHKRAPGQLRVFAHPEPAQYENALAEICSFINDGSGSGIVTRDFLVNHYINALKGLDEVASLVSGYVVKVAQPNGTGIREICIGSQIGCTIVGREHRLGQRVALRPYAGRADDLVWILENHREYLQ